jgi:dihydrofolate synthase/folylpolyglutamate synthase
MTYAEAIQFLYGLRLFGLKLGLENTRRLAELAGNPHHRLRFIHVAGTNGKGSTCAMLESVYRAAGHRVGLFTSPHLVRFSERIQVNRQAIPEAEVVRGVDRLRGLLTQFPSDHHPTFFEVVTVLALIYFADQQCDLVIWETGMGGRLDATNIVAPLASLITNIQFDHQKWLGTTRAQIAAEKAGIIKSRVPALTATDDPEALAVIVQTAQAQQAPLTRVDRSHPAFRQAARLRLSLLGDHQKLNAALAMAAVHTLTPQLPVRELELRHGLEHVRWPGRLQLIARPDGRHFLLDGAHNLAGAQTLKAALARYFPAVRPTLILGILEDKDWFHMCQLLAPLASRIRCVPVRSERTAAPDALARACAGSPPATETRACATLEEALSLSQDGPFVVVAGSLYLVGEAMELLQVSPAEGPSETALNEWNAPSRR